MSSVPSSVCVASLAVVWHCAISIIIFFPYMQIAWFVFWLYWIVIASAGQCWQWPHSSKIALGFKLLSYGFLAIIILEHLMKHHRIIMITSRRDVNNNPICTLPEAAARHCLLSWALQRKLHWLVGAAYTPKRREANWDRSPWWPPPVSEGTGMS